MRRKEDYAQSKAAEHPRVAVRTPLWLVVSESKREELALEASFLLLPGETGNMALCNSLLAQRMSSSVFLFFY
jgi:hypothetical protein